MKQLINNGRMEFLSCNGPANAGHHYRSAPSFITTGGAATIGAPQKFGILKEDK